MNRAIPWTCASFGFRRAMAAAGRTAAADGYGIVR
jgi:hypothetical protein